MWQFDTRLKRFPLVYPGIHAAQQNRLLQAMALDKKVSAGEIKFVLAERIGKVCWGQKVSPRLVRDVLNITEAE